MGWRRRLSWYPGDWIWSSLLALVVTVVAGGAAIWWTRDAESAASQTLVGDTTQLPTTVASVPSPPTTAPSTAPTGPTKATRTATTPRPGERRQLIEWPKGRSGWMLVLSSLPTSAGRDRAVAKARRALAAGLPQVGVLDSSRFSSLHPGYFVVFSGIYDTLREAQDAASKAGSSGYNAYPRRVTS